MKIVKSKKGWEGVILAQAERKSISNLILVLIIKDRNGNLPRKRILKVVSESRVDSIKNNYDLSNINPDWFKSINILPCLWSHEYKWKLEKLNNIDITWY